MSHFFRFNFTALKVKINLLKNFKINLGANYSQTRGPILNEIVLQMHEKGWGTTFANFELFYPSKSQRYGFPTRY